MKRQEAVISRLLKINAPEKYRLILVFANLADTRMARPISRILSETRTFPRGKVPDGNFWGVPHNPLVGASFGWPPEINFSVVERPNNGAYRFLLNLTG